MTGRTVTAIACLLFCSSCKPPAVEAGATAGGRAGAPNTAPDYLKSIGQGSPKAADLWQRTKDCAAQAEHEFQSDGYKRGGNDISSFLNHYDSARGICFVLYDATTSKGSTDGTVLTSKTLFDGFERKTYGWYMWRSDKVKKYWEVAPMECWVLSATGEKQQCKSAEEFDALSEPYVGKVIR